MSARHRLSKMLLRHGIVCYGPAFAMPATADRRDRLDRANSAMAADSRISLW